MSSHVPTGNDNANQVTPAYAYILSRPEDEGLVHLTNWERDIQIVNLPESLRSENPTTFLASQAAHSEIVRSGGFDNRSTQVSLATNDEIMKRYFTVASTVKILCLIIRLSTPKVMSGAVVDFLTEARVVNSGIVSAVGFSGMSVTATVTPEPFMGRLQVPRFHFSRSCNRVFGDPDTGCPVNVESWSRTTTIHSTTRSQRIVTLSILPPGGAVEYFRGGRLVHAETGQVFGVNWCDDGGPDGLCRVSLSTWSPLLEVGNLIKVYPGCRHTTADCARYGAQASYGGFPRVPNRNPSLQGVKP